MEPLAKIDEGRTAAGKAAKPLADLSGKRFGDFQILRRLGQGGMGQVYLAEQISLKRKVALKLLKAELAADPIYLQRFQAEAEVIARTTHANIVQVYAISETDGVHYMALEYVEGRNLRDYLAKKGPPDVLLALSMMRQVAAALQRAGELGIVHRDIKPENILLTRKGEVKVADFGLSRSMTGAQPLNLTQSGVTMGTPLYMSPEQVQGQPLDPRSDMYSFGVTCFHMLAGHPPFQGDNAFQVALQHVQKEPPTLASIRPDLPPDLCAVVQKMMAKRPEERYQTPRELLKDLARLRDNLAGITSNVPLLGLSTAVTTQPTPALATQIHQTPLTGPQTTVPQPHARRSWPWLAALACVGLLGGAASAWVWHHYQYPPPARDPDRLVVDNSEDSQLEALDHVLRHEQELRREVERSAVLLNESDQERGFEAALELLQRQLNQRRLKEADSFCEWLGTLPPRYYKDLQHLGRAMILAYEDKTDQSNEAFRTLLTPPRSLLGDRGEFLRRHRRLREMIARALDYNYRTWEARPPGSRLPEAKFPNELNQFRQPNWR